MNAQRLLAVVVLVAWSTVAQAQVTSGPNKGDAQPPLKLQVLGENDNFAEKDVAQERGDQPTVYLFDAVPGGVGLAEKLFSVRGALVDACLETVRGCECEDGCPGCVGPQVEPKSPAKRSATLMLERLAG